MSLLSSNSFTDILAHRAEHTPERTAYHFVSGEDIDTVSYARLYRAVLSASATLREHARPGDRVLVLPGPGERFVVAFLAALHSGIIAVPSYPPVNPKNLARLRAVSADAAPVAVIADAGVLDLLSADDPAFAGLARLDAAALGAGGGEPAPLRATPAFLQYTSGSTGAPKGVMVTHPNLLHNSAVIARQMRLHTESLLVSWLPPYHDMGLVGAVLQPLFSGFPGVLTPPMEFLQQPMRWLRLISRFGATVSGGPDFAFELCVRRYRPDAANGDDLDLSSWTVAFSGSEPIRPNTLNRFTETFAPHGFRRSAWFPCYGLAEATLFVSGGPVGTEPLTRTVASDGPDSGTEHVACGQLPEDLDVRIVSQDGDTPLPDGEVGEVVVAGTSVTPGYWNGRAPEQFGLRLPGCPEPFLRTGDLGLIADGQLHITGRLKDVLIIRGRNHYPQDVEACAERSHELIRAHGVAAFTAPGADGDRLVVVAEMFQRKDPDEIAAASAAIRRAVAEELGLHVHTVTPVRARALPRTANGKLQRQECRRQFLDGALNLLVNQGLAR